MEQPLNVFRDQLQKLCMLLNLQQLNLENRREFRFESFQKPDIRVLHKPLSAVL